MINKAFDAQAQINIARFNAKNEALWHWVDRYYNLTEKQGKGHFEAMAILCERMERYGKMTEEQIGEICEFIEEVV